MNDAENFNHVDSKKRSLDRSKMFRGSEAIIIDEFGASYMEPDTWRLALISFATTQLCRDSMNF